MWKSIGQRTSNQYGNRKENFFGLYGQPIPVIAGTTIQKKQ